MGLHKIHTAEEINKNASRVAMSLLIHMLQGKGRPFKDAESRKRAAWTIDKLREIYKL